MEKEINELKSYLNKRLQEISFPNSGGTVGGYGDKSQQLLKEIKKVKDEDRAFANKILENASDDRLTEVFSTMLKEHVDNIVRKFKNG